MGEIKYNGRTYSGLIQANGCFIDTNRIITSGTYSVNFSYTATEDCFVYAVVPFNGNSGGQLQIDGETINGWWNGSGGTISESFVVPIKKGQTVTATATNSSTSNYIVYGIQQGSPITFLSEYASACYDTNEREVGCWVDGKPIYQKTVVLSNVSYDSNWHDVAHGIANLENIVEGKAILTATNGYWYVVPVPRAGTNIGVTLEITPTNISYINSWISSPDTMYVTLQYTKTTDTAGSGKLTPTGFETHHYSTNEQIVGTWIDGKPLYERVFTGLSIALNGNDWVYFNDPTDIENVIDFKAFTDNSGRLLNCAITEYQRSNTNGIMFSGITGFNRTVNVIVARFTKTTD